MYPDIFTGCALFDGTIRALFSLHFSRSAELKSTNGNSQNCVRSLPAIKLADTPFLVIFSAALTKLCRIKRKIKGGSNFFLTGSTKGSIIKGKPRGERRKKSGASPRLEANFNPFIL
jgi:hypothetical protein